MFKLFKQAFQTFSGNKPRQTYQSSLLQSAKWLGWDGQPSPATLPAAKPAPVAKPAFEAPDSLLAHPAASRKAA